MVIIAYRHTERPVPGKLSGDAQIVVRAESVLINLIVPVRAGCSQQSLLGGSPLRPDCVDELVVAQHIRQFRTRLNGIGSAECDLQFVRSPFLGSDKDYPVGGTRTVDGGGRSIFQNSHAFNVVRVDEAQEVSVVAADTSLFQRDTVQYNQRVIAGIQ